MTDTTPTPQSLDLDLITKRVNAPVALTYEQGKALLAAYEALRIERDGLAAELAQAEERENALAEKMPPHWDGDEAQSVILTQFVEHAAQLDEVIEAAREADDYEGNPLTFAWDDETRTLSAAPADALAAVKREAAAKTWDEAAAFVDGQREDFDGDLRQVRDRMKSRAAETRRGRS